MKEFEKNKQLFASKLATKFEQRNNELSSSVTREKVKIFIKKINDDIQEIEAILADYDDKIAKNATIAVELS
jgi:predicted DNA-binding protein